MGKTVHCMQKVREIQHGMDRLCYWQRYMVVICSDFLHCFGCGQTVLCFCLFLTCSNSRVCTDSIVTLSLLNFEKVLISFDRGKFVVLWMHVHLCLCTAKWCHSKLQNLTYKYSQILGFHLSEVTRCMEEVPF